MSINYLGNIVSSLRWGSQNSGPLFGCHMGIEGFGFLNIMGPALKLCAYGHVMQKLPFHKGGQQQESVDEVHLEISAKGFLR